MARPILRLPVLPPSVPARTVSGRTVARVLGTMYVAGSLLALLWLAFPTDETVREWPLAGFVVCGLGLGVALVAGLGDAWPRRWLGRVLAVGTAYVTVAVLLIGPVHREVLVFYLWVTPLAFCFLSLRAALAHVGWLAVCVTGALLTQREGYATVHSHGENVVAVAALVVGTVVALGLLLRWLTLLVGQRDAALDATRTRLQAIVRDAPLIVFAVDQEGTITLAEGAGLVDRGLEPSDRVGRSAFVEYAAYPAAIDALRRTLAGENVTTEVELDGAILRTAMRPLRDASGRVAGATGVCFDVTAARRAEEQLRRLADQRRDLLAQLVTAQESERRRIARDIHDDTLQVLAVVDLRLQVVRRRLGSSGDAELVDRVQLVLQEATDRLRTLLFTLEPPTLAHSGLADAVREYLATVFGDAGVEWEVREREVPPLSPPTRTILYRIAQEALANARKHAAATAVTVEISGRNGGVELVVRDDGVGFDGTAPPGRTGHLGLAGMRERAELAGGWWRIAGGSPRGTEVRCWLPLTAPEEDRPVASSPHSEATGRSLSSAEDAVR